MANSFDNSLSSLAGSGICVLPNNELPESEQCTATLLFSTGELLTAGYWRVIESDRASISSFDHGQKYGLPAPIDAVAHLRNLLAGKLVSAASLDRSTGDLLFTFTGSIDLQVFNFTGYEIWDMRFPDGTVEYSNYNK